MDLTPAARRDADLLYEDAQEVEAQQLEVQGELPAELRGSFLRAGPGLHQLEGIRLNPFDATGLICALSFEGGKPWYRARHVRTRDFEKERAANKMLKRRVMVNKPGRWSNLLALDLADNGNHDVYAWGGHVIAADAPGHTSLDPKTLSTIKAAPMNRLRKGAGSSLAPMPRIDPVSGNLVAYSTGPGLLSDQVTFCELDGHWNVVSRRTASLEGRGVLLHDLAFTTRWYLAVELGRLSLGDAAWGARTLWEAVGGDPLHLHFVPRTGLSEPRRVPLPPQTQAFHIVNAFDDGEEVVVDLVLYDRRFDLRIANPPGTPRPLEAMRGIKPVLTRARVSVEKGTLTLSPYREAIGEAPCVHPGHVSRRHRYAYFAAQTDPGDEDLPGAYVYFHGIGRLDFDTSEVLRWSSGTRRFCSPPSFVPKPGATGEGDGWLLTWVMDAARDRSTVELLDASALTAGPIATVALPHRLPLASHVEFAPLP
jgi:all-trans-8'-apo-beta-carotenal 15,15'-oxygenase